MSKDKDLEDIIDDKELSELKEKSDAEGKLITLIGAVIGLVLMMMLHNFYSIYDMVTDDSISFVKCPRSFELDRPVVLKRFEDSDTKVIDTWIKSFSTTYILNLFPRTAEDVEPFFNYIKNHSEGWTKKRFIARLESLKSIKKEVSTNNFSKFYFKDSSQIKIRKISSVGTIKWKIVLEGFLHKKQGTYSEKSQPKVEMIIRKIKPTITNPEGLIVEEIVSAHIIDPVSGDKVDVL